MSDERAHLRLLEALLFAAAEPLDDATLAERLPADADVAALLARLGAEYAERGVNVVRVAGGWCLRTAPDLAPTLRRYVTVTRRLSRAAVETLAIIAYHQPITRAEIEEVRGVAVSRGTLDILVDAGWVRPRGRRQTPGRPATWVTTPAFLEHFGLDALDDLPGLEELRAAGLLGEARQMSLGVDAPAAAGDEGEAGTPVPAADEAEAGTPMLAPDDEG